VKIDFSNLNLAPTPNPKALTVEKVRLCDNEGVPVGTGYIRNASIHPSAHTWRW
jgi:hypothetical protein